MLWSSRRALVVLLAVGVYALASCLPNSVAQVQIQARRLKQLPPVPPGGTAEAGKPQDEFSDNITLPTDNLKKNKLLAIIDYIEERNWEIAITELQKIIDLREDVFVQLTRKIGDKVVTNRPSVKREARRLLADLPPAGLEFYRLKNDPLAARMLKEAKETSDISKLTEVMNRFLYSSSGAEATNLLGTYFLDRGTYLAASLCFKNLLEREGAAKLSPVTLFKAAYAFHQAGDKGLEDLVWKELSIRGGQVVMGGERRALEDLQHYVAQLGRDGFDFNQRDYQMYQGNPSRNGRGEGDTAFMDPRIRKGTVEQTLSQQWIAAATRAQIGRHQAVLPSTFPITATVSQDSKKLSLVVYRTARGIEAMDVKTGGRRWRSDSSWSMDMMALKTDRTPVIQNWIDGYYLHSQAGRPSTLFENSTVGTLSTDGTYVYAVDDLAIAPPPQVEVNPGFNQGAFVHPSAQVADAIAGSRLQAFDLVTGKLKWELGLKGSDLAETYFLGPPVPIAGRLYVLTEKQQELKLLCIDPAGGKVIATQTLAQTKDKMQQDVIRRMQAAHLSYGEGLLVCPTNAGAVLGVDLLSNSLVWAYAYREKPANGTPDEGVNMNWRGGRRFGGPPGMVFLDGRWVQNTPPTAHWQVSAPVIQDGKVVFTAPDARSVHCLNLRDGSRVWVHARAEDDLYLGGVFNGKVLIVGKRGIRAVSLSKGEVLWSLEVGLPSGQGIASNNVYYLPLKEASATKKPEICAIDIDRGVVQAHTKSRKDIVPGNLLFYEGDVLSQTTTEIMAFPQLKVKLAQIDKLITDNPDDPLGLTERGELRLDKGDLQGAIDDLLRALKNKPPKETLVKTRLKLYETLTEFFQRDFDAAEKYIKEYEDLCTVKAGAEATDEEKQDAVSESRRRRANFLCLVAKGREAQGKLVEAFERYMEFSALAGKDELMTVIDEPSVRAAPDVWSQGRIKAMAEAAKPEARKPLEDRIGARWDEVKKNSDPEELRKFVNLFGSIFKVGKEARLQFAERLMDDPDPLALLEAERQLSLLRGRNEDPQLAARAVECLARLNTRKGMLKDAAFYYRLLRRDYGNVQIQDGKTGSDLYDEQATDKRLLPFLDEPQRLGGTGAMKPPVVEQGLFQYQNQTYQLGQAGENLPFFQDHQLLVQYAPPRLKMIDRTLPPGDDKAEKWNQPLTQTHFQNLVYGNGQPNMAKFNFQSLGHLVVLPMGHMVFGIDPINHKLLWEMNLHNPQTPGQPQALPNLSQTIVDPRDGSVEVTYADGWKQRLGDVGPLEGNVLCLQTKDALVGIDPLTRRTLWTRSDVSPRNRIFGHDQVIYVVEMNNEGRATSTRALRAYDGVSVKVPDFAALYEKRVQIFGRALLVSEPAGNAGTVLRQYDVLTGKDLMKETFGPGALLLKSEDPYLTGMVEADGHIKIINLKSGKAVVDTRANPGIYKPEPQRFAGATSVNLVSDRQDYFVTVNGPPNQQIMQFGGPMSNLMPGTGLRCLPVNGWVFAFNGATGKERWHDQVPNQMLVLEHFDEVPMMLFTSRYQSFVQVGPGRQVRQVVAVRSIQKSNDKLLYASPADGLNINQFHALNVDAHSGKIEFISYNLKITHHLNATAATK